MRGASDCSAQCIRADVVTHINIDLTRTNDCASRRKNTRTISEQCAVEIDRIIENLVPSTACDAQSVNTEGSTKRISTGHIAVDITDKVISYGYSSSSANA